MHNSSAAEHIGHNSPASQSWHELIHAFRHQFDLAIYHDDLTAYFEENPLCFPHQEKRTVTLDVANQVNDILGEGSRVDYLGSFLLLKGH